MITAPSERALFVNHNEPPVVDGLMVIAARARELSERADALAKGVAAGRTSWSMRESSEFDADARGLVRRLYQALSDLPKSEPHP